MGNSSQERFGLGIANASGVRRVLGAVMVGSLVAACSMDTSGAGEAEPPTTGPGNGLARHDLAPGRAAMLEHLEVVAPESGYGVFAEVILESGETRTLLLETASDGTVYELPSITDVLEEGADEADDLDSIAEAAGESSSPGSLAPCSDKSKSLLPYKVAGPLAWSFNSGSLPAENSVAAAEKALKTAASNITNSRNSCAMLDQVSAQHTYLGKKAMAGQVTNDGKCQATGNGANSVGFGTLPKGVLGVACVFYDGGGNVVEADIRLNKTYAWFGTLTSSCSKRYGIEAVATHEFGHVFGLGHVAEAGHGNLTMSTSINGTCQSSEVTLGRGDVLALRAKY